MISVEEYRATGNYKSCKKYVRQCDGLLWYSGLWNLRLGGKHIQFRFRNGWCPLETLLIPNESGHDRVLREDAFFGLAAIFDRDDVKRVD